MKKGLSNFGLTMDTVKEVDEQAKVGFVLMGMSDGKKSVKFHLDTKNMTPLMVIGAIEQFKINMFTSKPKEAGF